MICRATVFVLFWLHLASYIASPSKFVWKFYLSAAPCCKQTSEWFQKKSRKGGVGLRIYFCENSPGIFHFFTLPLEIPDKTKLNPLNIPQNCIRIDPLEIPRPKTKTHGNSTLFFLGHPWKFHRNSTPGNSISSTRCLDFFWNIPIDNLTSGSFLLFINNHCWPDMLFHRQVESYWSN